MKLHIKNFRSIKQLDLELAPITVLYGHNGTGKSSALYAPLTLKNIVNNPNQHIQEFFDYGFARLGRLMRLCLTTIRIVSWSWAYQSVSPNENSGIEGFVIVD